MLLALVPAALSVQPASADDGVPPAAEWVSSDALIVVEIAQPRKLIERLFEDRVVNAITASPAYQEQAAKIEFQQAANLVKYLEGKYEADLPELLGKLLGGGITWAFGPDEASVLIVESEDKELLHELHEFILKIAKSLQQVKLNAGGREGQSHATLEVTVALP